MATEDKTRPKAVGVWGSRLPQYDLKLKAVLAAFSEFCAREGLRWFISFGSAIGTVRHGGMIPWDDDIDVYMPREDFRKLLSLPDPEGYEIVHLSRSSQPLPYTYAKFCDANSTIWEQRKYPCVIGVFIDVFPLEDMYSSGIVRILNGVADEALFLIASCVRMYNKKERLLSYVEGSPLEKTVRLKAAIGKIFSDRKDRNIWFRRCENWQSKCRNPESKYVTVSCGRGHYFGETYLRSEIFPVQPVSFEGRTYWAAKNPDHLLTVLYGSGYMTPEDPSHREVHSLVELDLGFRKEEREYDQSDE